MVDTAKLKAIDIKDVWQALGFELRGGGNARCFGSVHKNGDRNPSLGLDTKANRFKCFACDIQGDTIELVQQVQGVDFKTATEWLSNTFAVDIRADRPQTDHRYINHAKTTVQPPKIHHFPPIRNTDYTYTPPEHIEIYKAFMSFTADPSEQLRVFWQSRGLSAELLERAKWRTITKDTWLKLSNAYSSSELLEAGLLTERPNGYSPLFYNHTVAVPFYDSEGLIYLRARSLDPEAKAKYLAPKGTSPTIYNYQALTTYDGKRPLYVTESETDALALTELGETAIALVGGQKHPDSLVVRELVHIVTTGLSPTIQLNIATDRDTTGEVFFNAVAKALYLGGVPSNNIEKWQSEPEYKDIGDQVRAKRATERPNGLPDNNEADND